VAYRLKAWRVRKFGDPDEGRGDHGDHGDDGDGHGGPTATPRPQEPNR